MNAHTREMPPMNCGGGVGQLCQLPPHRDVVNHYIKESKNPGAKQCYIIWVLPGTRRTAGDSSATQAIENGKFGNMFHEAQKGDRIIFAEQI